MAHGGPRLHRKFNGAGAGCQCGENRPARHFPASGLRRKGNPGIPQRVHAGDIMSPGTSHPGSLAPSGPRPGMGPPVRVPEIRAGISPRRHRSGPGITVKISLISLAACAYGEEWISYQVRNEGLTGPESRICGATPAQEFRTRQPGGKHLIESGLES